MSDSESAERAAHAPDVLEAVDRAISALESHEDPEVRDAVRTLLEGVDAVHRAGLTHLVQGIHAMAGEAFVNRLAADPAIRLLLMSYNLIAVDRKLQAEEALDAVRGHLHDHGIDVEIVEVVGGVVTVRLHPRRAIEGRLPVDAVRRDIEAALFAGFVGFQELVIGDGHVHGDVAVVPLASVRRANAPVYRDVLDAGELAPGALRAVEADGVPILLAAVDGELYAIRNRCGDSPLPLEFGTLDGFELRCSWHGCRYDVRSGRRLDIEAARLQVFPVAVEDGRVRVAIDVRPHAEAR